MAAMFVVYTKPPYNPADLFDCKPRQCVEREVRTVAELDVVLDRVHARARRWPLAVCVGLTDPDDLHAAGLSIALGRLHSVVEWEQPSPTDDTVAERLSSWNGTLDEHPTFATNHGDEPAWKTIPLPIARAAARQFFTDRQRPANITWWAG